MKTNFLAATILCTSLCAGFAGTADARSADVEVNLGVLQKLNPNYQAPNGYDQRVATQNTAPKPKPRYNAPKPAPKPVATAPAPQNPPQFSNAPAPANAPLPANYDPAIFAPQGPSVKITSEGTEEIAPVRRSTAEAPPTPPAPTPPAPPAQITQAPIPEAPILPPQPPLAPPAPPPALHTSNAPMAVPPPPVMPSTLPPVDLQKKFPEMQPAKPAVKATANIPAPLPVPPPPLPKLAELPKTEMKQIAAPVPPAPPAIPAMPKMPPAPPPLVIKPEENVIKSTDSKPLLSPKDALEPPKIAAATPPVPAAPAIPAPPTLPTPAAVASDKLEMPTMPQTNVQKPSFASLPPIPVPPPPPNVKTLPPLPTTKKAEADLIVPPAPSQLPSLDKLFEKKDNIAPVPPAQTVAKADSVKVQTAGLPDATPPAAPAPAGSGSISIPYAEAELEIPPSEIAKLQSIADILAANKSAKVDVLAYASGSEDQVALALRTSFGRAVKIRKFFIDRNITEDRINVKALGNKSTSGVPDRVDVSVK